MREIVYRVRTARPASTEHTGHGAGRIVERGIRRVTIHSIAHEESESMNADKDNRVIVTDIRMPFMSMVTFMVKWAIAAIPAFIILSIIATAVMAVLHGMLGGPGSPMFRL
jgi:hypothetical protein